jgi:hypothetical protein
MLDSKSIEGAEKTKTLVIGDSAYGFNRYVLDCFPNLKTIIVRNNKMYKRIKEMTLINRLPLELINLSKEGHFVLGSNSVQSE